MHDISCFLTLTYNDENYPERGSLQKDHVQLFIKRLRKYLEPDKIRYFLSGEYGDTYQRPHYHAIVFNYWPEDARKIPLSKKFQYFKSEKLEKLWGKGFVSCGEANFKTAAYTAKYVTKKVMGTKDHIHYHFRNSEFAIMSRNPGIGFDWYKQYQAQTQRTGNIVINDKEIGIPDYYKRKWKEEDPEGFRNFQIHSLRRRTPEDRLEITEKWLEKNNAIFKSEF